MELSTGLRFQVVAVALVPVLSGVTVISQCRATRAFSFASRPTRRWM